jgi:hypothetical protein
MDEQKQTFIESLLTNKRLKPGQRERVLALAARELTRSGGTDLTQRVERIEGVVFSKGKDETSGPVKSNNEVLLQAYGKIDADFDLFEGIDEILMELPSAHNSVDSAGFDELFSTIDKANGVEMEAAPQSESGNKPNDNLPPYSDPSILSKFLFDFNQNSILRSACHDIDLDELEKIKEYCGTGNDYNYETHQRKVIFEFELLNKAMGKKPSYKIVALIRGYLTGKWKKDPKFKKSGWSSDTIEYHWLHESVLNWVKDNKDWPPHLSEGITLDQDVVGPEIKRFTSKTTGGTITYFRDLVLHFKNLFHFRYDNSIYDIIAYANQSEKRWDDEVVFEMDKDLFPRNVELFTDVDKVKQAYKKIVSIIIEAQRKKDNAEKPIVILSLKEDSSSVTLSILHKESVYQKSIQSVLTRSFGASYTNLIKNQINGLCELYLNADFGRDGYARINIWNGESIKEVQIPAIGGVEHELKFLKR